MKQTVSIGMCRLGCGKPADYSKRATPQWLAALLPLGRDSEKPFMEIAPWLIGDFMQPHGIGADGSVLKHYYPASR